MNGQVLELENVTKRFGDFTAVHDVSLTIPRGSILAMLRSGNRPKFAELAQWIRRTDA